MKAINGGFKAATSLVMSIWMYLVIVAILLITSCEKECELGYAGDKCESYTYEQYSGNYNGHLKLEQWAGGVFAYIDIELVIVGPGQDYLHCAKVHPNTGDLIMEDQKITWLSENTFEVPGSKGVVGSGSVTIESLIFSYTKDSGDDMQEISFFGKRK